MKDTLKAFSVSFNPLEILECLKDAATAREKQCGLSPGVMHKANVLAAWRAMNISSSPCHPPNRYAHWSASTRSTLIPSTSSLRNQRTPGPDDETAAQAAFLPPLSMDPEQLKLHVLPRSVSGITRDGMVMMGTSIKSITRGKLSSGQYSNHQAVNRFRVRVIHAPLSAARPAWRCTNS